MMAAFLPLAPFALFIAAGVGYTGLQSLGLSIGARSDAAFEPGFAVIARSAWFFRSLGYSLFIASLSTSISVVLGVLLALGLQRLPRRIYPAALVYKFPIILPHVVIGLVVLLAFTRSGVLGALLAVVESGEPQAGGRFFAWLPRRAVESVRPPGGGALVLAYVLKSAPFVALLVYAVLRRFDRRQVETARMLGAGPVLRFRALLLPVIRPPAGAAGLIVFLFSFGAFDLPFLLGTSRPPMLAIDVFNRYWYRSLEARPAAMASLVVMFVVSLVFVLVYFRVAGAQKRGVRHV